jgi:3,4-dihydroxy 2-butanone 4-phosphate synthase/GTP cyclohydrolase II
MTALFNSPQELIEAIRAGQMVVLMDDESRENEGDLVMAAQFVTAKDINFMVQYARGLVCLTLTADKAHSLDLPLMVNHNRSAYETNFTLSIEAAQGVTTGISAQDRATTIQAAIHPQAKPSDIVRPGHIFPIVARPGGVLARAGHTEASVDLAELAGLQPAGVIIEILKSDGSMARRDDCLAFAKEHGLKIGTIADLIEYRLQTQQTVSCIETGKINTYWGEVDYQLFEDSVAKQQHLALIKGEITDEPTCVRVHVTQSLDALGIQAPGRWSLPHAMDMLNQSGGVLILINQNTGLNIKQQLQASPPESAASQHVRSVGIGSQILAQLGVTKMRLLSSPKRYKALSGFGLEIIEMIPFEEVKPHASEHCRDRVTVQSRDND